MRKKGKFFFIGNNLAIDFATPYVALI